jgi:hypothetical protein
MEFEAALNSASFASRERDKPAHPREILVLHHVKRWFDRQIVAAFERCRPVSKAQLHHHRSTRKL